MLKKIVGEGPTIRVEIKSSESEDESEGHDNADTKETT